MLEKPGENTSTKRLSEYYTDVYQLNGTNLILAQEMNRGLKFIFAIFTFLALLEFSPVVSRLYVKIRFE
jgi:hypothetical protein